MDELRSSNHHLLERLETLSRSRSSSPSLRSLVLLSTSQLVTLGLFFYLVLAWLQPFITSQLVYNTQISPLTRCSLLLNNLVFVFNWVAHYSGNSLFTSQPFQQALMCLHKFSPSPGSYFGQPFNQILLSIPHFTTFSSVLCFFTIFYSYSQARLVITTVQPFKQLSACLQQLNPLCSRAWLVYNSAL